MTKMICFDMDGTIADFYGVPHWLELLTNSDPKPYEIAAPLWDMEILGKVLNELKMQDWEIRVISWLAKGASPAYDKKVREAKRAWLKAQNFPADKIHLVKYGQTKANSVRKYTDNAILIDDNAKVRQGWHLGQTIDPTTCDLISVLAGLLD